MKKQLIYIKKNNHKIIKIIFICLNIILLPHNVFRLSMIFGFDKIISVMNEFEWRKRGVLPHDHDIQYMTFFILALLYLINSIICFRYIKLLKKKYLVLYLLFI